MIMLSRLTSAGNGEVRERGAVPVPWELVGKGQERCSGASCDAGFGLPYLLVNEAQMVTYTAWRYFTLKASRPGL